MMSAVPSMAVFILVVIFALILLQEAVNGFHDTATAVATVIYSNSLSPITASVLAASLNFLGVLLGGTAVAFSLVFLLPTEMVAGINTPGEAALMLALVVTAVSWNLVTWWFGIPNSTTHTYIGSVLGVSLAYSALAAQPIAQSINWHQGDRILTTLLISPIFGFVLAWFLFKILRAFVRAPEIYKPHEPDLVPPNTVRVPLIGGLVGVAFLHGSNDGQKSIGLMLIILMGIAPGLYAVDPARDRTEYQAVAAVVEQLDPVLKPFADNASVPSAAKIPEELQTINALTAREFNNQPLTDEEKITLREEILNLRASLNDFLNETGRLNALSPDDRALVQRAYRQTVALIENVPLWLIVISALALGIGTIIGYKRIVTTLGERMGDRHMSAAQGMAAQTAAIASIAVADYGGVPVSTTHVLTSGVAGSVQSSGEKMQWDMIVRILITWFTTLPGTLVAAFAMGIILHTALA